MSWLEPAGSESRVVQRYMYVPWIMSPRLAPWLTYMRHAFSLAHLRHGAYTSRYNNLWKPLIGLTLSQYLFAFFLFLLCSHIPSSSRLSHHFILASLDDFQVVAHRGFEPSAMATAFPDQTICQKWGQLSWSCLFTYKLRAYCIKSEMRAGIPSTLNRLASNQWRRYSVHSAM